MKPIVSKLNEHVALLLINYVASQLLGIAQSSLLPYLMTRDIFKLTRLVMLYFPLVENIQASFCALEAVVVLIFTSQVGKLPF